MMKRIAIGILKFVLYVGFVVAAVIYLPRILSNVLDTPYPMATITSGSMWPVLKENDLILMKGADGAEVEIGKIIIYQNAKGFTIHRLIRRENGKLVTQGDANNVEDAPIEEEDVIGELVYIGKYPVRIPKLGIIAKNLGPRLQDIKQE